MGRAQLETAQVGAVQAQKGVWSTRIYWVWVCMSRLGTLGAQTDGWYGQVG